MTILATNARESYSSPSTIADTLLNELVDTSSLWYDLKLAEMSGYDYIFAPDAVCRQLCSLVTLEKFLLNVQSILGTRGSRIVLISYWHDRSRQLHFEKYCIERAEGIAIGWRKELLDNSPQQDFIEMLYEHSEKLILKP